MDKRIYDFKVIIEPDEDRWFAHCPTLKQYGASTWGKTYEEAYRNIHEVIQMVVDELIEDGSMLPKEHEQDVRVFSEPRVLAIA